MELGFSPEKLKILQGVSRGRGTTGSAQGKGHYRECPGEGAMVSKLRGGGIFLFLQPSGCLCNCQGLGLEGACLTVSSLHRKWGGRQRARPGLPDTRPCQPHKPHRKKPSMSETMAPENNNLRWLSAVVPLPHEIQSKGPHRTLYTVICLKISPKAPPLYFNTHMFNFSLLL